MKLVVLAAFIAVCGAAKLDRGYLPPASARTAGGNAEDLQTPIGHQGQGTLPKGSFTNEFQGVVVDAVAAGTRSSDPKDTGLGAPRPTYGSQDSKVGSAAFRFANQQSENQEGQDHLVRGSADAYRTNTRFGTPNTPNFNNHASASSFAGHGTNFDNRQNNAFGTGHERTQAAQERSANTLRFESEVGPESFNYAFETDNGISAEETAVATNGVQAQGAFSYTGHDGQVYSVTYTADEGGYQPKGDHLPTPPPIPEEILKSLEQNAKDEAAGLVDDGSYDAKKYNEGADYTESSGDNGQYQHGTDDQQRNGSPFSSASAFSQQSSGHASKTFASADSGQAFNAGSHQRATYNSNTKIPDPLSRQSLTHDGRNNQYNRLNINQGAQNVQGSQEINTPSFNQHESGHTQAITFSRQGQNEEQSAPSILSFGQLNSQNINNNNQQNQINKEQQKSSQELNKQTFNQNSNFRTQANSFASQGQNYQGNKQAFSQTSFAQQNKDITDNINRYSSHKLNNQQDSVSSGEKLQHLTLRQSFGQNLGLSNHANTFGSQGQNGNRQAFSQPLFGQTNSHDSTSAPSTDSRTIENQFNSHQINQQNRFGQTQNLEKNIHDENINQYLPPIGQNKHLSANSQSFSDQSGLFNTHNNQPQFSKDISEQQHSINTQHLETLQTNNPLSGPFSANSQANINSGISQQQNQYPTLKTEVPKLAFSGFGNRAESSATFGVKMPINEPKDVHKSAEYSLQGFNNQKQIQAKDQSSPFGSASFGAQKSNGNIISRFNTPLTESPVNYQSSSTYNQKNIQFKSPSVAPQTTAENSAQASAQFGIQPENNGHELFQQKYSPNSELNSQQTIDQFGQKQFNVNDQSNNALFNASSGTSSLTTQESYNYKQPPKAFNSPISTQFGSSLNLQNRFNSQSQLGTTPSFQAIPTPQTHVNRFPSSASKISGEQSQFSHQFQNQRPFFQAQPQSVAQASAQYQSNGQSQGFQKQTTAFPQQFQPLRQPFGQSQQETASAQFNTASSLTSPSFGSPKPSEQTQQYNGEIYEYNKPSQTLPAPNHKDQDGSSTQVSSQSSFSSVNQRFRGTSSQLTGSSVSGKGEVFGGPRKPPSFDEHGYHY